MQSKNKVKREVYPIKDLSQLRLMYMFLIKHGHNREAHLLMIGCNLALRFSDLCKLSFNDLRGDHLDIKEKKTSKTKTITFNSVVKEEVEKLREWYRSINYVPVYLFESTRNNRKDNARAPITPQWVIEKFKEAAEVAMIDLNIGTHSMRKTWGYHAYKNGTRIEFIQKMLNHSSPQTTLLYIGITQEEIEQAYHDHEIRI